MWLVAVDVVDIVYELLYNFILLNVLPWFAVGDFVCVCVCEWWSNIFIIIILIERNIILKTLHAYYENKEMNFTVLFLKTISLCHLFECFPCILFTKKVALLISHVHHVTLILYVHNNCHNISKLSLSYLLL